MSLLNDLAKKLASDMNNLEITRTKIHTDMEDYHNRQAELRKDMDNLLRLTNALEVSNE